MTLQRKAVLIIAATALAPASLLGAGAASAAGASTPAPTESHNSVDGSMDHHRSGATPAPGNDRHPGMAQMHQQMLAGNPGMARMHRQMMGTPANPGGSPT